MRHHAYDKLKLVWKGGPSNGKILISTLFSRQLNVYLWDPCIKLRNVGILTSNRENPDYFTDNVKNSRENRSLFNIKSLTCILDKMQTDVM